MPFFSHQQSKILYIPKNKGIVIIQNQYDPINLAVNMAKQNTVRFKVILTITINIHNKNSNGVIPESIIFINHLPNFFNA